MNIFATEQCPHKSAMVLPDKHIVKMPLESCQMLSIIYSKWYYNWGTLPKADGTPYSNKVLAHVCILPYLWWYSNAKAQPCWINQAVLYSVLAAHLVEGWLRNALRLCLKRRKYFNAKRTWQSFVIHKQITSLVPCLTNLNMMIALIHSLPTKCTLRLNLG